MQPAFGNSDKYSLHLMREMSTIPENLFSTGRQIFMSCFSPLVKCVLILKFT